MIRFLFAFVVWCVASTAQAVPLRLDYTVTDLSNGTYQYDFDLVTDNSDGDFVSGTSFDWFIIGATPFGAPLDFTEGFGFFTALPAGAYGTTSSGGLNGPTLCFGTSCGIDDAAWTPTSVGESVSFSGVSSTLLAAGDLEWAFLQSSAFAPGQLTLLEANDLTATVVPLPAPLMLLGAGLLFLGGLRQRRS